jgi:hypothetical protein
MVTETVATRLEKSGRMGHPHCGNLWVDHPPRFGLRNMLNLHIAPFLFEIFGNKATMAMVWLFFAAQQATTL